MNNFNLKPFLFILLGYSGIVWFLFATADGLDMSNLIDFMRPIPKVVTADLFLYTFFSKWGWRWRLLQGWLVPFPNLNGTWEGVIQTNWKDKNENIPGPIPSVLTIKQTFGHVSCVMRTSEMESYSYAEGFRIDNERQIRQLCYSYTSKPNSSLRDRSTPHDGSILFNIIGKPVKKLEGEYWTQRQTTGTVALTYKTKKLLDELPSGLPDHPMAENE